MHAAARALHALLGVPATAGAPLEREDRNPEPPRLQGADALEPGAERPVGTPTGPEVAAFLDGVQRSRVLAHWEGRVPLVHGAVGAVVRRRRVRRLGTWAVRTAGVLCAPRDVMGDEAFAALAAATAVEDTSGAPIPHPAAWLAQARSAVERGRERLERALAEAWCAAEPGLLWVDGGLGALGDAARGARAMGVVKSHRTLYAAQGVVAPVLALAAGHRTAALRLETPRRAAVASWYLRLRDPRGRGPLHGLVRVECAADAFSPAHADRLSRAVLAERTPLALPDPRWDVLAYGVHDCEAYLRAVLP